MPHLASSIVRKYKAAISPRKRRNYHRKELYPHLQHLPLRLSDFPPGCKQRIRSASRELTRPLGGLTKRFGLFFGGTFWEFSACFESFPYACSHASENFGFWRLRMSHLLRV